MGSPCAAGAQFVSYLAEGTSYMLQPSLLLSCRRRKAKQSTYPAGFVAASQTQHAKIAHLEPAWQDKTGLSTVSPHCL